MHGVQRGVLHQTGELAENCEDFVVPYLGGAVDVRNDAPSM